MFINGTSVETGQRIIASDVEASSKRPQSKKSLFPLAFDLHEMRPAEPKSDIFLSTAFTVSARFPIISPHGILRGRFVQTGEKITDRIVDSGYFENDGLATAADIADTLKEAGLQPLIVSITNDPISADRALGLARAHQDNQPDLWLPKAEDKSLFESFTVIGRALYATGSGHELGDTEYAKSVVGPDRLFLVTVRNLDSQGGILCRQGAPAPISGVKLAASMKDVSMSWWISQPEQAFLDAQLCLFGTSDEIVRLIKLSGRDENQ